MYSRARCIPQRVFVGKDASEVTKLEKVIIVAVCPKAFSFLFFTLFVFRLFG
jgi:hypothetical protein